jgi:hypothetical protein
MSQEKGLYNRGFGMNHYLIQLLIIIQVFFLSSCAGTGDWSYSNLPSDYEIWKLNPNEIALVNRVSDTSANEIVGSYVSEIAWNDNFILAQQQSDSNNSSLTTSFYIVDVNSEEVYGPLSEVEFHKLVKQMQIMLKDSDWILTSDLGS